MYRLTPLGALSAGLLAGFAGTLAQDLFFALTRRIAPSSPKQAFEPPAPEQRGETATETVARRAVEDLAQRGPLVRRERAARLVHYGFGTAWGGAYGIVAGSLATNGTPAGGAAFGAGVWMASDNLLLPAFRLAAWPQRYPLSVHGYAVLAHLVYGSTVALVFASARRAAPSALGLLGAFWLTRRVPRFARPAARRLARRGVGLAIGAREIKRAASLLRT